LRVVVGISHDTIVIWIILDKAEKPPESLETMPFILTPFSEKVEEASNLKLKSQTEIAHFLQAWINL
jgi:hypothetical protein